MKCRNLAQVKVGDAVKFAYYESLAVRVLKKGEAFPTAGESAAMARAKPGEKPAGVVGTETSVNATITAIDKKAKTATLKGEDGKSVTVTPRHPEKLDEGQGGGPPGDHVHGSDRSEGREGGKEEIAPAVRGGPIASPDSPVRCRRGADLRSAPLSVSSPLLIQVRSCGPAVPAIPPTYFPAPPSSAVSIRITA